MRKGFRSTLSCVLFLWSSLSIGSERPNIVLLLADDLGFSDLGSYGSEVSTPNLDELARQGVRFSNYHTAASCAPTRSMLMTGVDSHRNGVANMPESLTSDQLGKPGYEGVLNDSVVTVATLLKDAGYHTYMTGKWHLGKTPEGLPSGRGFERTLAMADTGADNWEQKPYLPIYSKASWFEDGKETSLPDDFYSSRHFIDKTIEYIDSNLADGRPFFAYVAFQAVHLPVQAPREFTEKYMGVYDDGWTELRQRRYKGAIESGVVRPGVKMAEVPTTLDWQAMSPEKKKYNSKRMAVYAGMIDAMDFHIGRLLSYLKEKELYENTVFIFVSDNGSEPSDPMISSLFDLWMKTNNYNTDYETLGEKGSFSLIGASFASAVASPYAWYKFFAGEGGLRVPMLISGLDSTSSGSVIDAFSWVTDIVPTMLQLANVKAPDGFYQGRSVEPIVGHSLLPLISGSVDRVYGVDEAIGYELGGNAALFKGPYKILKNRGPIGDDAWHLYHLENDPGEANDLKDVEPLVFESLMLDYRQYVEENGVLPVADDYDQRRQVMIYGLKKRLGNGIPITIGLVLLFVLFLGFARYQRRRSLRSRSQS